jgi:hypothetical protein
MLRAAFVESCCPTIALASCMARPRSSRAGNHKGPIRDNASRREGDTAMAVATRKACACSAGMRQMRRDRGRSLGGSADAERAFAPRRRKALVDRGEILGREREVEGTAILAHMLGAGSLRDDDRAVPAK